MGTSTAVPPQWIMGGVGVGVVEGGVGGGEEGVKNGRRVAAARILEPEELRDRLNELLTSGTPKKETHQEEPTRELGTP